MAKVFSNGYALIIGVGYVPKSRLELPETIKDASDLYALITNLNYAAYEKDKVELLTGSAATKTNILHGLKQLEQRTDEDSTVIIYYSGHGGTRQKQDDSGVGFYLIPYDFERTDFLGTTIDGSDFSKLVNRIPAKKCLVIYDCCHAEGVASKDIPVLTKTNDVLYEKLDTGRGIVVIAACERNQVSYGGHPNSLFTQCLMEALAGANTSTDKDFVDVMEIIQYVRIEVPKRSNDLKRYKKGMQNPLINRIENLSSEYPICLYQRSSNAKIDYELANNQNDMHPKLSEATKLMLKKANERKKKLQGDLKDHYDHLEAEIDPSKVKKWEKKIELKEQEINRTDKKICDLQEKFNNEK